MLKKMCLGAIAFYQSFISPVLGANCRYYPSCSEYAKQAFYFQNSFFATLKTLQRILTCNQFFCGGIAYPYMSLKIYVKFGAPCRVAYWLIPCKAKKKFYQIPKSIHLTAQKDKFYIVKNYVKVSRV